MRTTEMARLFQASGRFLSLYMATSGDVENAGPRVELRWKNARTELFDRGVPETLLEAVDPLVEGSQTAGASLAVIASVDGILWSGHLPTPPPREVLARWTPLPSVVPLLRHLQSLVPHVAVLASRAAAEVVARTAELDGNEQQVAVEGERPPHLSRTKPGGWSQPRYQHRSEVLWERNAVEVAMVLAEVVDQVRPRFVAVAGDVRAVQFLRDKSPKRVRELMQVVGGELPTIDAVLEQAGRLVEATVERDTGELLDRFERERAQHDLAADGVAATFEALARSQVDVLLVSELLDDDRTAWFGETGHSVALDRDTLLATGEITPAEGPLVDVAIRAALLSGATVRVLEAPDPGQPEDPRHPTEGLGALLRFATA
jgi:Bacterial archaeo-eukaryotic release factor family 2